MEKLSDSERKLVEENFNVIYYTLNLMNVRKSSANYEELLSASMLWLCLAAKNYNEESGTKFSTYAIGFLKHQILWYRGGARNSVNTNLSIDGEEYRLTSERDEIGDSEDKIFADEIKDFMEKELTETENTVIMAFSSGKKTGEISKKLNLTGDMVRAEKANAIEKIKCFVNGKEYGTWKK